MNKYWAGCALALLGGGLLLAGCSPLQQAPLVYSSKVAVGIDVSATATEQPGAGIVLGYKQVDAAYVPVAVAKPCDSGGAGTHKVVDCTDRIYEMTTIRASNKVGQSTRSISSTEKLVVETLGKLQASSEEASLAVTSVVKEIAGTATSSANVTALNNAAGAIPTSQQTAAEFVCKDPAAKASVKDAAANCQKIDESVKKREAAIQTLRAIKPDDLAKALAAISANDDKTDAFSVFGSFDADSRSSAGANASTPPGGAASSGATVSANVGLVIGKVFSTGVASQNLTSAMQNYYSGTGAALLVRAKADCVARAIEAIGKMPVSEASKVDAISKVGASCDAHPPAK